MITLPMPAFANVRRKRNSLAVSVMALLLGSAVPAAAQPAWPESDGEGWTFYGQINQAYLHYDDSVESRGFFTVDNANNLNGSNFGFLYDGELNNGVGYSGRFQLAVTPRPSNEVSLQNPAGVPYELDAEDISYLEIGFQQPGGARLFFGQGDMTANLSAPDYSGTTIIAGPNVSQIAGDMLLRFPDGTLSDRTLSDAIGTYDSGRKFRLRYDSRMYGGFSFSGSIGQDVEDSANDYTDIDAQISYEGQNTNWRYAAVLFAARAQDPALLAGLLARTCP
jgi:opacity protein-like surface antigen